MAKGNNSKKGLNVKVVTVMMLMVLIVGCAIGGTVAWLLDKTENVTNTFSTSDISITLDEGEMNPDGLTINKDAERVTGDQDFKMIPGWTIEKDPKVKVTTDSEDCYLFVKVEKTGGDVTVNGNNYTFDNFIAYAIQTDWTELKEGTGVYYRVIDGSDDEHKKGKEYSILGAGTYSIGNTKYTWKKDQVLTKPEVTKEMMAAVKNLNQPKLSFTAYAVQLWKSNKPADSATPEEKTAAQFTPDEAWAKISN